MGFRACDSGCRASGFQGFQRLGVRVQSLGRGFRVAGFRVSWFQGLGVSESRAPSLRFELGCLGVQGAGFWSFGGSGSIQALGSYAVGQCLGSPTSLRF